MSRTLLVGCLWGGLGVLFTLSAAAAGPTPVHAPGFGMARYPDGTLRTVSGSPASFIISSPVLDAVRTSSFGDEGGVVSADGRILFLSQDGAERAAFPGDEPNAVVGADASGEHSAAWLPATHTFVALSQGRLETLTVESAPAGRVLSLRFDHENIFLLAADADGGVSEVKLSRSSGQEKSVRFLPGLRPPAIYMEDSVLSSDDTGGLTVLDSSGGARALTFPATPVCLERMSKDWVHVCAGGAYRDWAVRLTMGSEHVSQLPAPAGNLPAEKRGVRP